MPAKVLKYVNISDSSRKLVKHSFAEVDDLVPKLNFKGNSRIRKAKKEGSLATKIALLLLLGFLLVEAFVTWNISSSLNEKARPANLNLIKISQSTCQNCTSVNSLSSSIENSNFSKIVSSRTIDFSSPEARSLIQQYGIQSIPAVIVTGEFKKDNIVSLWAQLNGRMLNSGVVIESAPPYVNATDGSTEGLANLIMVVDSSCTECSTLNSFITSLQQVGVQFASQQTVEYNSSEGKSLIASQNIQRIPALLMSKDILTYKAVQQYIVQTNGTERDGYYAYDSITAPYLNLSTGKVDGLVSVIYLNDSSCANCYNVYGHKTILPRYGIRPVNETTYDVNSTVGSELVSRYNITGVPTIIVSPEGSAYPAFVQVWATVGNVAPDGWFVFRNVGAMGNYTNITA